MSQSARIVNRLLKIMKLNKMFLDIEGISENKEMFKQIVLSSRAKENCKKPPVKLFKNYDIKEIIFGSHTTHILKQKKGTNKKIAVYFHGGAYVKGPMSVHWKTIAEIANGSMYDITVIDYPKTPEYTVQGTIVYCLQVIEKIFQDYRQCNIAFIGDSAGGGLALSVFMMLRDLGKALPFKLVLLSPWMDISMSNKEIYEYKDKDFILTIEGLISCGLFYAGGIDNKDWRVSPMYGNLDSLPETHIFTGGSELFYPDCRDFVKLAIDEGHPVKLHFYPNMQHDWVIMPFMSEARQARNEIIEILLS